MQLVRLLLKNKLNQDIAWTIGSFVILAASGIIINLVVAGFRDAASLGVFNQSYAIYIVASQIATFGLHYSVLRHSAYHEDSKDELSGMLVTAVALSILLGAAATFITFFSSTKIGDILSSPETGKAITYASLGLIVFPLNKVLLAFLNGLRKMREYALLQAGRYTMIMAWVAYIAASSHNFEYAALGFFIAEVSTLLFAGLYILRSGFIQFHSLDNSWMKRHLVFGSKSLLAGMFVEMNSRIDVLLIGFFLSDRLVGIYSFAAMLIDGLYHILAMVRLNFNPVLVGATRDNKWQEAKTLLRNAKIYGYPITAILAVCVGVVFVVLATVVVPEKGLMEGLNPLIILLVGLTLISAYIPFDNLLLVSGHPGYQTLQHLAIIISNITLNISLVPVIGIVGAAIATALSYLIGIAMLVLFSQKLLAWNLVTNKYTG